MKRALAALTLLTSCLATVAPAHAVAEGKYLCMTDYAAMITSDEPPYIGRATPGPNGLGKFFVTIVAYRRLSVPDQQAFRAEIDGTGFVIDGHAYAARFEAGASIDDLRDMAFGYQAWTDGNGAPHIYRSRFGGVLWLTHDDGFIAFVHTNDLNDLVLRGRCELLVTP